MVDEKLRAELVAAGESSARKESSAARIALAEDKPLDDRLQAALLALAIHRAPRTICPSDAARAIGGDNWIDLMTRIRRHVRTMAYRGDLVITQHGKVVNPELPWRGPIRLHAGDV